MAIRLMLFGNFLAKKFCESPRSFANPPPTIPKSTPISASFTRNLPSSAPSFVKMLAENPLASRTLFKSTLNLWNPSMLETLQAENAAAAAGSNAPSSKWPTSKTSKANAVAAIGAWKIPANPAASPVTSITCAAFSNGNFLLMLYESAEPICIAAPSRPALPPKSCVSQVLTAAIGIETSGKSDSLLSPTAKTWSMPRSVQRPHFL